MLGKTQDAVEYSKTSTEVKTSFNSTFFNPATKEYATGSQTANAMAVYMDLVETENREAVINNIIKDLKANDNRLTAGDIGYRYLLQVLEDAGRSDVIFEMNNRSDVPGYGYQLARGATSLTESWSALPTASNNHLMLGHIMEWFYSGLCGIRQSEGSVGFHKIDIRPEPVGDITFAKAGYESPYGLITSSWKKSASRFEVIIDIPANTSAIVHLPGIGKKIEQVGSGHYVFEVNDLSFIKNSKL